MNIIAPFVAHLQTAKLVEPGQGTLDDSAMPSQPFARRNPPSGNAWRDTAFAQVFTIGPRVVRFGSVQRVRPAARPTAWPTDGRDCIDLLCQHRCLMPVGCRMANGERRAPPINDQMTLRARLAAIGRVRSRFLTPRGAGRLAASNEARSQSIWSAALRRRSKTWWTASHTPACCQSRSRRQHVMPLPQPIAWGKSSHWMPRFTTNRMPVNAARSGTRGRPPFGFGGTSGSSGSMIAHNSSGTSCFAIDALYQSARFC